MSRSALPAILKSSPISACNGWLIKVPACQDDAEPQQPAGAAQQQQQQQQQPSAAHAPAAANTDGDGQQVPFVTPA
jgi:hypothetical protein